jgi:hypothetical protein
MGVADSIALVTNRNNVHEPPKGTFTRELCAAPTLSSAGGGDRQPANCCVPAAVRASAGTAGSAPPTSSTALQPHQRRSGIVAQVCVVRPGHSHLLPAEAQDGRSQGRLRTTQQPGWPCRGKARNAQLPGTPQSLHGGEASEHSGATVALQAVQGRQLQCLPDV